MHAIVGAVRMFTGVWVDSGGDPGRRSRPTSWLRVAPLLAAIAFAAAPAAAQASGTAAVTFGSNGHFELGTLYKNIGTEGQPVPVIGVSEIKQVVSAGQTSYALLTNGTVRSWGANLKEELGDGVGAIETGGKDDREAHAAPISVKWRPNPGESGTAGELTGVTAIAAAYGAGSHGLAIVNDSEHEGEVVTWGAAEFGERGNGESGFEKENSEFPRSYAMFVPHLKHIVAIAAGGNDDFAIQEEGGKTTLWSWGENIFGHLGIGSLTGPTECKGENKVEQACATEPQKVHIPELAEGVKVIGVSSYKFGAYALLSNGKVLSWGDNSKGQLGTGTEVSKTATPEYVCAVGAKTPCGSGSQLTGITAISAGAKHALALTESGEVVGWGYNDFGELTGSSTEECPGSGGKTFLCQDVPKKASGLEHVSAISAGDAYSLALKSGVIYGFGANGAGQLGVPTTETCIEEGPCSRSPLAIEGLATVGGMSAGTSEGPGEVHTVVFVESGSGPTPLLTATGESKAITETWTINKPEFKVGWRVAGAETWNLSEYIKGPCSTEKPCSFTVKGLEAETTYEVKLEIWTLNPNGTHKNIGPTRQFQEVTTTK